MIFDKIMIFYKNIKKKSRFTSGFNSVRNKIMLFRQQFHKVIQ